VAKVLIEQGEEPAHLPHFGGNSAIVPSGVPETQGNISCGSACAIELIRFSAKQSLIGT